MNRLPASYLDYLKSDEIKYGETDLEWGNYFDLEPIETLDKLNEDIELEDYYAFASNGGGELFVFDNLGAIFILPLIGMENSAAIKVADTWEHFLSHVQNT